MALETTNQDTKLNDSANSKPSVLDLWFNKDTQEMIPYYKKQIGYIGEVEAYKAFMDSGLSHYLKKHNQFISFKLWLKTIAKGCDFVFKVGRTIIKIEASTISKPYFYHNAWFKKSRLPRLLNPEYTAKPKGCKKNPFKIIHVWLIMGIEHLRNYEDIKYFASGFGVLSLSIAETITLLNNLVTTTASNQPPNIDLHILTNCNCTNNSIISHNSIKKAEIEDLDMDKEIDKYKKLGLFTDYGFSS